MKGLVCMGNWINWEFENEMLSAERDTWMARSLAAERDLEVERGCLSCGLIIECPADCEDGSAWLWRGLEGLYAAHRAPHGVELVHCVGCQHKPDCYRTVKVDVSEGFRVGMLLNFCSQWKPRDNVADQSAAGSAPLQRNVSDQENIADKMTGHVSDNPRSRVSTIYR